MIKLFAPAIALALILAAGDAARNLRAQELTPQQRIDQAWQAMHEHRSIMHTLAPKGEVKPQPQAVETCTKKWCEPHRKGLEHLKPFEGNRQ